MFVVVCARAGAALCAALCVQQDRNVDSSRKSARRSTSANNANYVIRQNITVVERAVILAVAIRKLMRLPKHMAMLLRTCVLERC